LPGVESAIASLNRAKCRVIVVTNQRGIALGRYSRLDVDVLHDKVQRYLATFGAHIDAFYVCPYDKGQCECRKPATGLFRQAARDFPEVSAANSLVIGDSLSDIEAGRSFGFRTMFIKRGGDVEDFDSPKAAALADAAAGSLEEAIDHLNLD
jgi:D-glycero-D-manno-heptose 1,7-bisphosphate phosphatase